MWIRMHSISCLALRLVCVAIVSVGPVWPGASMPYCEASCCGGVGSLDSVETETPATCCCCGSGMSVASHVENSYPDRPDNEGQTPSENEREPCRCTCCWLPCGVNAVILNWSRESAGTNAERRLTYVLSDDLPESPAIGGIFHPPRA